MADDRQPSRDAGQEQSRRQRLQSRSDFGPTHLSPPLSSGTHPSDELLSALWPEIEPDLRRTLRRWVGSADVDDAVQEVFIRLERRVRRRPVEWDALRDLACLAATNLGKNAARDARRRAQLVEDIAVTEAQVARTAVSAEDEAGARISLETVMRAIAELSDIDRRAIARALSSEKSPSDKRERDRLLLQLFRARSRLRAKVADVFVGLPVWRLRSWYADLAHVVGSAGAVVVVVTTLGTFGHDGSAPLQQKTDDAARVTLAASASVTSPAVGAPGSTRRPPGVVVVRPRDAVVPADTPGVPRRQHELVVVSHPTGGDAATVNGSDRGERRNLACVGGGPIPTVVCVPHPLRR